MTFKIREATATDIPEIISLLKASLGESKLPKSERIWNFKHRENPFGPSLVLIAVEGGKIIGVRAFMRWKWQYGDKEFSAFRAVDTATHPDHQGKGIFKKLTLKAIEISILNGENSIFNTPNSQSLPGYLKMGWNKIGNLGLILIPVNPFYWGKRNEKFYYKIVKKTANDSIEILTLQYNQQKRDIEKIFTPKTSSYLKWRYEENPLQQYEIFSDEDFYLAGYVKKHKYFNELRIVEHIYRNEEGLKKQRTKIKTWSHKFGVQVISIAPSNDRFSILKFSGNYGPTLTFRELNLNPEFSKRISIMNRWNYTLGDLELF